MFYKSIWYLKKIYHLFTRYEKADEILPYRKYLFEDLLSKNPEGYFENKRILEIGPRDGLDTFRLEKLKPKEIIIFDLPDKTQNNLKWMKKLNVNYKFVEKNFMYISKKEYEELGKFDLIYFTGVLYHNPEQLKFLYKLYEKLNDNGSLVLESATTRKRSLVNKNIVEIYFPKTYRNTSTVTHLPSKKAINSWLQMVGFSNIFISSCYDFENLNIKKFRHAVIAIKKNDDLPSVYYSNQISKSDYFIGGST